MYRKKYLNPTGRTEISKLGYYNSKSWKDLRAFKISNNPLCENCLKNGVLRATEVVDHIEPITLNNTEKFLEYNNLQSLCNNCHWEKTHNKQSKYSRLKEGEELKKQLESD